MNGCVLNMFEKGCDTGMSWNTRVNIRKDVLVWPMFSFRSVLETGRCSGLSRSLSTVTMC